VSTIVEIGKLVSDLFVLISHSFCSLEIVFCVNMSEPAVTATIPDPSGLVYEANSNLARYENQVGSLGLPEHLGQETGGVEALQKAL
jgi:hypothetical protein